MRSIVLCTLGALVACSSHKSQFEDASTGVDVVEPAQDATEPTFDDVNVPDTGPPDAHVGPPVNQVPNGDFEKGNVSFSSDYSFADPNTLEGQYTVGTNGQAWNGALVANGDHTSGKGKMFLGNGKSTPDRVWYTASISVNPGTDYFFEAFVMNLCCTGNTTPVGPSELSFYANGQLLGTRTSTKIGVWEGLSTTWSSGSATKVDLKLVNANTVAMGNDFAVDDVFLGTESIVNPGPK